MVTSHSLADAVAKRYRPWPKGLRTDSLPWFDSPLVQGASRLRYTDKAQVAATGPYWPKGARNKKKGYVTLPSRSVGAVLGDLDVSTDAAWSTGHSAIHFLVTWGEESFSSTIDSVDGQASSVNPCVWTH